MFLLACYDTYEMFQKADSKDLRKLLFILRYYKPQQIDGKTTKSNISRYNILEISEKAYDTDLYAKPHFPDHYKAQEISTIFALKESFMLRCSDRSKTPDMC